MTQIKLTGHIDGPMPPGPDPSIKAEEILEVMLSDPDPAYVVSEIADKIGAEVPTTRKRMKQLVEEGLVHEKKPSKQTAMYWETDKGRQYYFDQSASEGT